MIAMTKFARAASLLLLLFLVPPAAAAPTDDLDSDGIPDAAEGQLCGRAAVRDLINRPDVPGACPTTADFDATQVSEAIDQAIDDANEAVDQATADAYEAIDQVAGVVNGTFDLVDADTDFIPDATESAICQVEDQNDPRDGVCSGNDYALVEGIGQCDDTLPLFLCMDDEPGPITRFLGLPFGIHFVLPNGGNGNL